MKNGLWVILMVLVLATSCSAYTSSPRTGYYPDNGGQYNGDPQQYPQQNPQQYGQQYGQDYGQEYGDGMDMDSMYNYLAPYGNWVYMRPYGYVWTPRHMGYQWRPYSNGHWVMTDFGWTWVAYEPWGAIPFHYGRWGYDDYLGWYWVPGTTWGPAWVSWRWSDQYAGWAPLQPGIEIRLDMDFGSIGISIPNRFWIFLQTSRFLDQDLNRYALPYERNASLIRYTSLHNGRYFRENRFYNEGIGIDLIRRVTRREVPQYRIQNARQAGRARITGKDLQVYRPALRLNEQAKPKAFLDVEEARREKVTGRIFEPKDQVSLDNEAAGVRRRQAEEKALLLRTQDQDLKEMQRQRNLEVAKIRDNAEKEKILREHRSKLAELRKQQQEEKLQLVERHKKDREVVQQVAREAKLKKQAAQVKKKKGKN